MGTAGDTMARPGHGNTLAGDRTEVQRDKTPTKGMNVSQKREKRNGPRETWLFVALTKPKVPVKLSSDVEFEAL